MDKNIARGLNDRIYEKRKAAALDLEHQIRECISNGDAEKIHAIIGQLCRDYAYAVHQPNARNGGLIGLAAAAIALGQNEVPKYLDNIIHPVLACFGDQDARVRYYACESLYNIAKISKGEILLYFNEIFDVLCKLSADSDASVKNGADLLDRLVKDIVSEKATSYVSVINTDAEGDYKAATHATFKDTNGKVYQYQLQQEPTAFSLPKFIPLLMERIYSMNPFTRIFLVSWITLLDSVPDLELVSYLPAFLSGLLVFLTDTHTDVRVITQSALDIFLHEIRRISELQKLVKEQRSRQRQEDSSNTDIDLKGKNDDAFSINSPSLETSTPTKDNQEVQAPSNDQDFSHSSETQLDENDKNNTQGTVSSNEKVDNTADILHDGEDYIPGQDVHLDYSKIIEILISHLDSSEEKIQLVVLTWIETLLEISPLSFIPYLPKILSVLLVIMAINKEGADARDNAKTVNESLMQLVNDLDEKCESKLNYSSTINTLILQFLNENEITRIAALQWLTMLHKKSPKKLLEHSDDTFITLLKALSDSSEKVINADLQLLSEISFQSDDETFSLFMLNLLQLFKKDQKLLETRGNFVLRRLCVSLNPDRIYTTLAKVLEKETDLNFVSIMIQTLNNNLITAPELSSLRKRLRNLENKQDWEFFASLFRAWCHNAPAALSLCLLAQAYELAYSVLTIFVDFEITVNVLVQIDILVQLLESPVFTRVRLQLLEPEKYPYLYKCLYGILMLLPQSTAFTTLKNRLTSVSLINTISTHSQQNTKSVTETTGELARKNFKWIDLLDRFKYTQQEHENFRSISKELPTSALPKYSDTPISEKVNPLGNNPDLSTPLKTQPASKDETRSAVRKLSGRSFRLTGFGSDK